MPCFGNGRPIDDGGAATPCVPYHSLAYKSGSQTLFSTVKTVINMTAVEAGEDPAGTFNLVTDQFTIPFDGNWTITSTIEMITSAGGICFHGIEINSGGGFVPYSIAAMDPFAASFVNLACAVTKYMVTGEIIQVFAQQNTGFNATINGVTRRVNASLTSACIP